MGKSVQRDRQKSLKRTFVHVGEVYGAPGDVLLATDAACDSARAAGGFVSTTGVFGFRGHGYSQDLVQGQARVVVSELRAVYWGLVNLFGSGLSVSTPLTVLCDSPEALALMKDWRHGSHQMPTGYRDWRLSGSKPTLEKLREMLVYTENVKTARVKGHEGHPLNELADSLAKLALRGSRGSVEVDRATEISRAWAAQALRDFQRSRA
jgi:ribonuclease HI